MRTTWSIPRWARSPGRSACPSLIDKPVAIFPDARLSSRPDNAAIVECLLSISGEDDQTIDRKHLAAWTGRLPTRFVLISNELPRLRDASGALASRLDPPGVHPVVLRSGGHRALRPPEARAAGDLALGDRGLEAAPPPGRFIQPRSGRELLAAMEELASPISAFLRDRCVVGSPGDRAGRHALRSLAVVVPGAWPGRGRRRALVRQGPARGHSRPVQEPAPAELGPGHPLRGHPAPHPA